MKILFVLPRMVTGGVERVTLRLAAELQSRGHECAFALRRAYGDFLPEAQALCPVHEVATAGVHAFVPNLAKLIRKWQPTHVVTAFSDIGFLTDLAIRLSGHPTFWAHGVHSTHSPVAAKPGWAGKQRYWLDQKFSAWVYQRCHAVVAVSQGVRDDVLQKFKCPAHKVFAVYNPVLRSEDLMCQTSKSTPSQASPRIVALGRLTRQKGFDILIDAMAQIPQPWHLEIWGDGEDRQALQQAIHRHGLHQHIRLCGHTHQPLRVLRNADLFVLSSRYEGFGLVLVEALASLCTIVSTDCPHGPKEILENGKYGFLVENENPKALADGIQSALKKNISFSPENLLNRANDFSVVISTDQWESILQEA